MFPKISFDRINILGARWVTWNKVHTDDQRRHRTKFRCPAHRTPRISASL